MTLSEPDNRCSDGAFLQDKKRRKINFDFCVPDAAEIYSLETNSPPMSCGCFVHWQTLHADVVVIITNARADLNCIPCALVHRTFDALTIRLLVKQSRIKVGQTFHPIPETAALKAHLTAHRLVIGNSPTVVHRKLVV